MFQLDPVLPAQYQNTFHRRFPLQPEKTLMLAVLEDAITCFQKYASAGSPKMKQLFDEAEQWILEQEGEWLFSFEQVCSTLGWNPDYVRKGLMREKERLKAHGSRIVRGDDGSNNGGCKRRKAA